MDQRSAERAALGALLLEVDFDVRAEVCGYKGKFLSGIKFVEADFIIPAHREIFRAIELLKETGQPIDAGTVYDSMAREGSEAKLLLALLGTIVKDMPTGAELLEALKKS